eukprot:5608747-Karenia_brevis.AAC.1
MERALRQWLQRTARHDFRVQMREVVAKSFNDFTQQVVEFTRREGRQPSRYARSDSERCLGEQVHNCLRGRRQLEFEQIEELRAFLQRADADGAPTSTSRKRKADAAVDVVSPGAGVASEIMRSEADALPATRSASSDAMSGPPLGEEGAAAAAAAEHVQSMDGPERSPLTAKQRRYWATPGVRLPHMRVAPRDLKGVQ